jgi:sterol 3beta-glucosyltransferase
MPTSRVKSKSQGHITVEDKTKSSTVARVNSDGQVNVKFHSNPKQLAAWFERFEGAFQQCPEKAKAFKRPTFKDEKAPSSVRLNIAIQIVGSRGDVQPFIPIAQMLSKAPFGHRVRICTHPIFKDFVESNGIEFFSIGGDPEALMAYMVKNPGLLPSRESLKAGDIGKRLDEMKEIMAGGWRSCIEAGNGMGKVIRASNVVSTKDLFLADAIIANPPSMAHIHCAQKLNIPLHMVFTMPWSPTKQFHHPLAAMTYNDADPSVANYLSFMMMELLTWEGLVYICKSIYAC